MTGRLVLTAAQFDGLATGFGDVAAMGVLRDGQLAKRKLLLQALLMSTPALDDAAQLLIRAESIDPEAVAETLRLPHVDAWATHCLRDRPGTVSADDIRHGAAIAAAAAIRAGLTFAIAVPARHGVTHLPGLGSAVGADQATATVARAADGRVTVTGRRGQITFGRTGWEPRRAVELEPGFTLHLEDQEPYRDCYQWRPAPRLDQVHADRFAELLHGAWAVLTARHPQHAAAIRVLLRVVVPLVPNGPGTSVSAASRHAGGSVAIALPDTAEELALLLQHEFMHMKLDNVRDLTDLHHRQSCGRFLAPWRMDPRPVGALFQGVFAHAGVTDYWRTRRHSPAATPLADLEFAYWREQNRIAVAALSESGELTPAGERFVSGLRETLAGWETEVVPATIAAKVDIMVQAQTTRWRLRNWTPGPGELPPVVRAWRAGHPPGVVDPVGTLRAETDGEPSGVPGIVGLIRESIVRADAVADGADRALLVGDRAAAVRDYAARATREPGDDDAWVGLAVAADGPAGRALRLRPDLVRGLFAQLSDGKPMVLARWLGTSL